MIDLDSHLLEPRDFLVPFAPVALRDALVLHGAPTDDQIASGDAGRWSAPGAFDRVERRALLDQFGIQRQVVLPGLAHLAHLGTSAVTEAARAQRRAVAAWADDDPRFVPVAVVPVDEPQSAIDLIGDAAEAGFRLVLLTTGRQQPALPTAPDQIRIWHALADSGMAGVLQFGTTGSGLPDSWRTAATTTGGHGADAMDRIMARHSIEAIVARLALSAMFARTPSPRVLIVETGASWLLGLFAALDAQDPALSAQTRDAITVVPFAHESIGHLIDRIGQDVLGFATLHPQADDQPDPIATFAAALGQRDPAAFFSTNGTRLLDGGR
jgi:predicted TIM-barrel fold metal-dependent hydrolase